MSNISRDTDSRKTGVQKNGLLIGAAENINFIEGANITFNITHDPHNDRINVIAIASGGGEGSSLTRYVNNFSGEDWITSGGTSTYTILDSDHGFGEYFIIQVYNDEGEVVTDSILVTVNNSLDVILSVTSGSQFTGYAVLIGMPNS